EFDFKVRATNLGKEKTNITGRAYIKDFFGNLIKEYNPWTNSSATSVRTSSLYTPNLLKGKAYSVNATLYTSCNESDTTNNNAMKLFAINSPSQSSDSYLNLATIYDLGSDHKAKFGQTIRVKAEIYKGDTTKDSIALWIANDKERISKETKTNVYSTFTNYTLTLPIQIMPNCDLDLDDGKYQLYMEGLDKVVQQEIEVADLTSSMCEEIVVEKKTGSGEFVYKIIETAGSVKVGQQYMTKVELENNGESGFPVEIWSYVYRGSKGYSGDKEENKKAFYLEGESSVVVELPNIVVEADPGDYKFKVVINKDGQKTNKEIVRDLKVIGSRTAEVTEILSQPDLESDGPSLFIEPVVKSYYIVHRQPTTVYESSDVKAENLIPNLLIISLGLCTVFLILRKE
ncbi:MAG: hypothetical protein KJ922_00085, partial [Nanoarchaeota archaeon]|nr:hypothetical protein [Nanoarchaeota archaeon]